MSERALLVHATHLLQTGAAVASDPAGALSGVIGAVRRALAFKDPEVAVALLDEAPDWGELPAVVQEQHTLLAEVLRAHGFAILTAPEPIHLVAAYTAAALESGRDVIVVGSDKRLAQLVWADRVWWYDAFKRVRYTPESVRKRFEVGPAQVAGWLALVGDRDSLPGVPGVGKKGATTLLSEHDSVEAALEVLDQLAGRTGKALQADPEAVRRELGRAHLDADRRLPVPIEELRWKPPETEALNRLYSRLGLHRFLESAASSTTTTVCASAEAALAALDGLGEGPTVVLPISEDPSPARGELVGVALSRGHGRAAWVPRSALEGLRAWLADATVPKLGHDTKGAWVALDKAGFALRGVIGDTECASHLHDSAGFAPHDLPDIVPKVLHRPLAGHDEARGVGRRRRPWGALKPQAAADHHGAWAIATADLWAYLGPRTDPAQLAEYFALGEVLAGMERRGVACDVADLQASAADFLRLATEVEGEIHALAGKEFNVGSTKQLGEVLFADLELPIVKRTKTGWSTASDALERIEQAHPIVPLVLRWRRMRWLRTTWSEALQKAVDPDGRVRGTFHHARSFSGRIICSHPDLTRVPGRTPEMTRIRHAFHAPAGRVLLSVDYDQLGLYMLAHLSGDPALCEPLRDGGDLHRITAATVLCKDIDALTVDERQIGKVVNFATFAGQGASALALQLGVSAADAKAIIARFFDHYRGVRAFQDGQLAFAREHGYVETIGGRRWPIGGFDSMDPMLRSYADRGARRSTHEGSVADITRWALLHSDRAMKAAGLTGFPILQMLDEVLFEVPREELEETLRVTAEAMRTVAQLRVPLRVSAKAGERWGSLQPMAAP